MLLHSVMPEDLNWMAGEGDDPPAEEPKEKPYKYFLKANHQDIVELALVSQSQPRKYIVTSVVSLGHRAAATLSHTGRKDPSSSIHRSQRPAAT